MNDSIVQAEPASRDLRARLQGRLLGPGDAGYDAARRVWNGLIDRKPALIAQCLSAADVAAALNFARERDLRVSVRGGGHNAAGYAVCEGGLMIDLSPMKAVTVDPGRRLARAQPGLTWGELDRATQAYGLAAPGGVVSTTGIAGLTLGGGIGWLRRKHGLTCDNLLSVEIVTAAGRVERASETENPDLFWAVRGGGGNFGVVTEFEYRLHPVGPRLMFAGVLYPIESAPAVLRAWRDYMAEAPNEVCSDAICLSVPPHPSFPLATHGRTVVFIQAVYVGATEEGMRILLPLRQLAAPLEDLSGPAAYVDVQASSDFLYPAHELLYYWKSLYLSGLGEDAIERIVALTGERSSPRTQIILWRMGGALAEIGASATAFAGRGAPFMLSIDATWSDPAESARHIEWAQAAWETMQAHAAGGLYVNFPGLGEDNQRLVQAAYGGNYERLQALKRRYDPDNLFRLNQNIRPAGSDEQNHIPGK